MVAIVTNGSHHSEPLLWALGLLSLEFTEDAKPYRIGSTVFACCNNPSVKKPKDWKLALGRLQS